MKRANVLIVAGVALLVVGLIAVWVISRDDDGDGDEPTTPVLVAQADLAAGLAGEDAVASGKVAVVQVPESKVPGAAYTDTAQLAGTIFAAPVADGTVIGGAAVRPATLRSGSFEIPDGLRAVALDAPFVAGGAGYVGPGDRIDVYVNIPPDAAGAPRSPYTQLLLSDVEVLDTSTEVAPTRSTDPATPAGARSGANVTLLVALDPAQAEQAIFANSQNELWVSVRGEKPGESTTAGVDYGTNYVGAGS